MKDKRTEAVELMKNAQYSAAIPLFLDLLESNYDDFGIHYMIGQCYNFNGQFLESTNSLKKAEEIMNEGASIETKKQIYLALGIAHQKNKEFDKAVAALEKGISKCPNEFILYNSLGLTYKFMNNLQEALHSYNKAHDLIIEAAIRTEILATKVPEGESCDLYNPGKLTLKSSPEYCTLMSNIGYIHIAIGDLESAEEALKHSIDYIPDGFNYPPPYDGLAIIDRQKNT